MHQLIRNTTTWGTFGKFHNEPLKQILICDLSDSHLLHIIYWLKKYPKIYAPGFLELMENEAKFRVDNYIFVKDYEKEKENQTN